MLPNAAATYPLRSAVLRPLLPPGSPVPFAEDAAPDCVHFGLYRGGASRGPDTLLGIATIFPAPWPGSPPAPPQFGASWQLRGMATAPSIRGQGGGAALIARCLCHVARCGGTLFWCNGRVSAAPFYLKQGFSTCGPPFEVPVSGPHYLLSCPPRPTPFPDAASAGGVLLPLAVGGDARAAHRLGTTFLEGCGGVPKDDAAGVWWVRASARGNDPPPGVHHTLGVCTQLGLGGMEVNLPAAVASFRRGVDAGDVDAGLALGRCLARGEGVQGDPPAALALFLAGAAAGSRDCVVEAGDLLVTGWAGTPSDPVAAVRLYTSAAESGHALACYRLATLHCRDAPGLPRNSGEGWRWLRAAAAAGEPDAIAAVAKCLFYVEGTFAQVLRDAATPDALPEDQFLAGSLLFDGETDFSGTPQESVLPADKPAAIGWWTRVAGGGGGGGGGGGAATGAPTAAAAACVALAEAADEAGDTSSSSVWWLRGAEKGHPAACGVLAQEAMERVWGAMEAGGGDDDAVLEGAWGDIAAAARWWKGAEGGEEGLAGGGGARI